MRRKVYLLVSIALICVVVGVVKIRKSIVTPDGPISSLYKYSLSQPKTDDDGSTLTTTIYLRLSRSEAKESLQKSLGQDWLVETPPNGNYIFKQVTGPVIVIYLPRAAPLGAKSVIKYQRINTPF